MARRSNGSAGRRIVITAVVLLAGACSGDGIIRGSESAPRAETVFSRVLPGATMPLVLTNASVKNWDYGACPYAFDRREEGAWTAVQDGTSGGCIAIGYVLRPGDKITWPVSVPEAEGTYRIRFRFLHFPNNLAEEVFVISNSFQVAAEVAATED
jgi:hypothetical protein